MVGSAPQGTVRVEDYMLRSMTGEAKSFDWRRHPAGRVEMDCQGWEFGCLAGRNGDSQRSPVAKYGDGSFSPKTPRRPHGQHGAKSPSLCYLLGIPEDW
jgi:hypothetical protein